MHTPQGALAEAVHGIGFVSTVDDPWPPAQPQLNRFPAMVYCSLNFFTEGAVALPADDGELRALPDWVVSGPRTQPIASLTLAPLRTVGVVLYPDAFALLTGLAPAGRARPLGCGPGRQPAPHRRTGRRRERPRAGR